MTDQLPADIAEAIEAFQNACYGLAVNGAKGFESKEDAMRAALNAVILGHLGGGWQPMESAPKDCRLLAIVDGDVRVVAYGKTSHVPIYGWCLADQGAEEFDLCEPTGWIPFPATDLGRSALAEEGGGR